MDRDQAVNLVELYDGVFPEHFKDIYLAYYQMTEKEFDAALDKWVNRDLFQKINEKWIPQFKIK
jgi:hypothetical protein